MVSTSPVGLHCTRGSATSSSHCFLLAGTHSRSPFLCPSLTRALPPSLPPFSLLCLLMCVYAVAAGMTGLYLIRKFFPTFTPTDTGEPHLSPPDSTLCTRSHCRNSAQCSQ